MKMRKMNTTKKMVESGALAIVRADVERACEIADGLIKGGVPVMEMSYTFNTAGDVIKALKEKEITPSCQRKKLPHTKSRQKLCCRL